MTIIDYLSEERNSLQDTQAADEFYIMEGLALRGSIIQQFYPGDDDYPWIVYPPLVTREPQDWSKPRLFQVFESLYAQGLIEFYLRYYDEPDAEIELLSYEAMARIVVQGAGQSRKSLGFSMMCRLTDAGGQLWERTARPQWDKYIWTISSAGELEFYVESPNRALIEEYLQNPNVSKRIVPGSLEWELEEPGEITYWETLATLPIMYRVTFQYTPPHLEDLVWVKPVPGWYTSPFPENTI